MNRVNIIKFNQYMELNNNSYIYEFHKFFQYDLTLFTPTHKLLEYFKKYNNIIKY